MTRLVQKGGNQGTSFPPSSARGTPPPPPSFPPSPLRDYFVCHRLCHTVWHALWNMASERET